LSFIYHLNPGLNHFLTPSTIIFFSVVFVWFPIPHLIPPATFVLVMVYPAAFFKTCSPRPFPPVCDRSFSFPSPPTTDVDAAPTFWPVHYFYIGPELTCDVCPPDHFPIMSNWTDTLTFSGLQHSRRHGSPLYFAIFSATLFKSATRIGLSPKVTALSTPEYARGVLAAGCLLDGVRDTFIPAGLATKLLTSSPSPHGLHFITDADPRSKSASPRVVTLVIHFKPLHPYQRRLCTALSARLPAGLDLSRTVAIHMNQTILTHPSRPPRAVDTIFYSPDLLVGPFGLDIFQTAAESPSGSQIGTPDTFLTSPAGRHAGPDKSRFHLFQGAIQQPRFPMDHRYWCRGVLILASCGASGH